MLFSIYRIYLYAWVFLVYVLLYYWYGLVNAILALCIKLHLKSCLFLIILFFCFSYEIPFIFSFLDDQFFNVLFKFL